MKSMSRVLGLGLFGPMLGMLGGCAVDASVATSEESTGVARQADSAGYVQVFDEYFQSIIFQPSAAIDWVDLHVTINGTRTTNVRMPGTGTSAAAGPSYEI